MCYCLSIRDIGLIYENHALRIQMLNVSANFDKPMSIPCLVTIRTRFGLYTNMLTVFVTLNFDILISKSIGIIYTSIQKSVPNLMNVGQFCVLVIFRTRFGLYINMLTVTVTLTFDLKINRDHLPSETHVCAIFDKPRSILCLVIIRTRFGRPTNRRTDRLTDQYEQSNISPLC